jgi:hypothetical protein
LEIYISRLIILDGIVVFFSNNIVGIRQTLRVGSPMQRRCTHAGGQSRHRIVVLLNRLNISVELVQDWRLIDDVVTIKFTCGSPLLMPSAHAGLQSLCRIVVFFSDRIPCVG